MTERWIGFCAFHLGDYKRALSVYQALGKTKNVPEDNAINLACCFFFLGMYSQVEKVNESSVIRLEKKKSSNLISTYDTFSES